MANRNFANSRIYTGHVMPVAIDCNFVVDSANGNGLGIRSLKGPYVQNVFMHTSATAGAGNTNPATPNIPVINPNPASGTIVVQLQDNYNRLLTSSYAVVSPVGSSVIVTSGLTVGVAYVITILGDASAADWLALGVPAGVTPAVGVAFIAKATGHGAATVSRVAPSAAAGSGSFTIEGIGDANLAIAPSPSSAQGFGAQLILQVRNASGSSAASAIAAPADGTVISLSFLLSNSSILIAGE
jgi:hypothetical protein